MSDYEELVRELREADEKSMCGECGYKGDKKGPLFAKAADAIEELKQIIEQYKLYLQDALKDLRSAHEKEPKWISVDERLPEQDVSVIGAVYCTDLIISEDGESIAEAYARCQAEAAKHPRVELCFYGEDGWYGCDGYPMICAPSYWMPLPEPPKEEK